MSGVASAVVGAVGLGYSIYKGVKAGKEEKREKQNAETLQHPFLKVQDEYFQNRNIAAANASGGLPQGTKDYLDTERKRGLSSSLQALKEAGVGASGFDSLLKGYNESIGKEASADAEAHLNNIQYFMQANKDIAGQKSTQFGVNELQPYENKLAEITERRRAAKINEQAAIEEGIGTIGTFASTASNNNYMNKLFGNKDPYSLPSDGKTYATENTGSTSVTDYAKNYPQLSTAAPQLQFNTGGDEESYLPEAAINE